jgi:mannose-6-phosphate isomerase-like protein (cupin superfamily)
VIIEGRGQMVVGDEQQDVEAGMLVFIPPGQSHAIRNIGDEKLIYISATSPPFAVEHLTGETWLPAERSVSG